MGLTLDNAVAFRTKYGDQEYEKESHRLERFVSHWLFMCEPSEIPGEHRERQHWLKYIEKAAGLRNESAELRIQATEMIEIGLQAMQGLDDGTGGACAVGTVTLVPRRPPPPQIPDTLTDPTCGSR